MGTKLSRQTRSELLEALSERYRNASKIDKTKILDEFILLSAHLVCDISEFRRPLVDSRVVGVRHLQESQYHSLKPGKLGREHHGRASGRRQGVTLDVLEQVD
jgi:hypothetical protein